MTISHGKQREPTSVLDPHCPGVSQSRDPLPSCALVKHNGLKVHFSPRSLRDALPVFDVNTYSAIQGDATSPLEFPLQSTLGSD